MRMSINCIIFLPFTSQTVVSHIPEGRQVMVDISDTWPVTHSTLAVASKNVFEEFVNVYTPFTNWGKIPQSTKYVITMSYVCEEIL